MNLAMFLDTATTATTTSSDYSSSYIWMVIFILFMVGYMFVITRKDKKQQNAEKEMRESLKVGDEVLTIGGILGKVTSVREDSVDIETGADRNKLRFTRQAIAKNITADAKAEEIKQAKLAQAKEAAAKKSKK